MIPEGNRKSNVERFTGYGDTYDAFRPAAPAMVLDILTAYLGRRPSLVADIGCGTGLSTFVWKDAADRIVGVEPNADMMGKADSKLAQMKNAGNVSFMQGYSNQLPFQTGTVDIVTCSQSFHWMDPSSTLMEVARVLGEGGVFAAYDCDWPPTIHWRIEAEYVRLIDKAEAIAARLSAKDEIAYKHNKDEHLTNLKASGAFRYTKEIVFHNEEACDAERYAGLAISQGGLQTALKFGAGFDGLDAAIDAFRSEVDAHFGGRTLDIVFSYRMRLGVK